MLPNFLLLGPRRTGSSWIFRNLNLHPEIFIPEKKSTYFFSDNFEKGQEWYENYFNNCSQSAIGEATVEYISSPEAPGRIYSMMPDVKLITVLRHPVERAYSSYNRQQGLSKDGSINSSISFSEKLKISPHFIDDSLYAKNINRYLKLFPKRNFKVLYFDDIKKNAEGFLKEIYSFLEVDSDFDSPLLSQKIGSSEIIKANSSTKPLYYAYRGLLKFNLYGPAKFLYKHIKKDVKPLDNDLKLELTNKYFLSDIEELEQLIEIDLSHWKRP